jgi:hypothetical protein
MAYSTIHFSLGMIVASALRLPPLARAWKEGQRLSRLFLLWFAWSYALGVFALIPNLLHRMGCPADLCAGWWTNVFLFFHLLNQPHYQGRKVGEFLILCLVAMQYGLLLAAIARRRE